MSFWRTMGITVQGKRNEQNEIECQDVTSSFIKNGISVIALSDGAGSKPRSAEGASIVTSAVTKYIVNNFTKIYSNENVLEVKKELVDDLLNRLAKRAKKYNCDIQDFASTLMFVAIKEDKQCIVGHIGDGVICRDDAKIWKIISKEEKKGAVNETNFVTTSNSYASMNMLKSEIVGCTSFALLTDGSETSLIKDDEVQNGIPVMASWVKARTETKAYDSIQAAIVKNIKPLTNDDCGLAYLTRIKKKPLYNMLSEDEVHNLFDKHYTHLYNTQAAIKDAKLIIDLLTTTNANIQYISKKTKVKIAPCTKIINILVKADFINEEEDLYSAVTERSVIGG